MFRRRTSSSSSGKIHYRINIDKSMCPNPVDIYIDNDIYQHSFNGSSLDIYRDKKIEVIRIGGQISQKDQQYEYNILLGVTDGVIEGSFTYEYNSGNQCILASNVIYGNRITNFTPITRIIEPNKIINFTYDPMVSLDSIENNYIDWGDNSYVINGNCIRTDLCEKCKFEVTGKSKYRSYRVNVTII